MYHPAEEDVKRGFLASEVPTSWEEEGVASRATGDSAFPTRFFFYPFRNPPVTTSFSPARVDSR
jgi:hypothetical protein